MITLIIFSLIASQTVTKILSFLCISMNTPLCAYLFFVCRYKCGGISYRLFQSRFLSFCFCQCDDLRLVFFQFLNTFCPFRSNYWLFLQLSIFHQLGSKPIVGIVTTTSRRFLLGPSIFSPFVSVFRRLNKIICK